MEIDLTRMSEPQRDFFLSDAKYTCYGGARGGGKSWGMRTLLVLNALKYPGLNILLLRRTLPELRENHIVPMRAMLHGVAKYNATEKTFTFQNGSRIVAGYLAHEGDILQYQGISIHAPRAGSDVKHQRVRDCKPISIHAPRAGSDSGWSGNAAASG